VALASAITAAVAPLDARAPQVDVAATAIPPRLTTAAAQAAAPRMKLVSSWTTDYPIGDNNCKGRNITIPTSTLDGYVVAPGAGFDFWKAIGGITREQGYCAGAAIASGHSVHPGDIGANGEPLEGALGGGICSCSTTLFNAALRLGLEMGARKNHYYYIDRYPVGLDATVFKSGDVAQSMTFTNDTAYPIAIRGINSRSGTTGHVRFELYSVPTGRHVTLSKPVIRNLRRAQDSIQFTTNTAQARPGSPHRREVPIDGFDVTLTRTVTDDAGRVLHQERWTSRYGTVTGVLFVYGKGADIVFPPGVRASVAALAPPTSPPPATSPGAPAPSAPTPPAPPAASAGPTP
jgi:vancomycin resistance protein YoaR